MSVDNLKKLIEESRRRERESQWEGTFLDYLALVKENPAISQLAPGRICSLHNLLATDFAYVYTIDKMCRMSIIVTSSNERMGGLKCRNMSEQEKLGADFQILSEVSASATKRSL